MSVIGRKSVYLLFLLLLCTACTVPTPTVTPTPQPEPSPTLTPEPTTPPLPTSTPTLKPPDPPSEGYSNVYGRVTWRGEPVFFYEIYLGNPYGNYLSTRTDPNGRFVFEDVLPYNYYLWGSPDFPGEGTPAIWRDVVSVPEETNFYYGDYALLESDLVLNHPWHHETETVQPEFSWEPYPGAAYYQFLLASEVGQYISVNTTVEDPAYTPEKPLLACSYQWDVIAFDDADQPLARSMAYFLENPEDHDPFHDGLLKVTNPEIGNCQIHWTKPDVGATRFENWVDVVGNPLVVHYTLAIDVDKGRMYPSSFFSGEYWVDENGVVTGPAMPTLSAPKKYTPLCYFYFFYIKGFDAEENLIAETEPSSFIGFPMCKK